MRLARPQSKSIFYKGDGTGRDTYIAVDNGGLYRAHNTLPEFPIGTLRSRRYAKPITPSTPHRTVRYKSNGTGRDMYISDSAGGFEIGATSDRNSKFEGSLRNYLRYNLTSSNFFADPKQRMLSRKRFLEQQDLVVRLSAPKYQ